MNRFPLNSVLWLVAVGLAGGSGWQFWQALQEKSANTAAKTTTVSNEVFDRCVEAGKSRAGKVAVGPNYAEPKAFWDSFVTANFIGNRLHRSAIIFGGGGKSGFEDVHAEIRKGARHAQLLRAAHGKAWCLLAIAQRRIENQHAIALRGGVIAGRAFCFVIAIHFRFRAHGSESEAKKNPAFVAGAGFWDSFVR